jgi:Holliday junction resolvasome RuvABC endonuclease subunit
VSPYTILALDPGPTQTGWARLFVDEDKPKVLTSGVMPNEEMLFFLTARHGEQIAIEMIASYGMAVGREVFETCVWIGRFIQACRDPGAVRLVYRKDVKMFLCGSPRAKDSNIRQALLDLLGPQGVKANPGPTYGVKSHAWPALAVAVTVAQVEPKAVAA